MTAVHVVVGAGALGLAGAAFLILRSREDEGGAAAGAPSTSATDREVEALARVIASEAGGEPWAVQVAVAFGTINEARTRARHGTSIRGWAFDGTVHNLVTYPDGQYGPQNRGAYCSTARAASAANTSLAADVIAGRVPDLTQGAQQYDSPQAQRALLARGTPGYTKTPEEVADARIASGNALVLIPGVPEERFRMWRRA